MKDAKQIFRHAELVSEPMIIDRILVRVLPDLVKYNQLLTAEAIKTADHIWVSDDLYAYIHEVAEALVGMQFTENSGLPPHV